MPRQSFIPRRFMTSLASRSANRRLVLSVFISFSNRRAKAETADFFQTIPRLAPQSIDQQLAV
jgi:hypothetical protein